MNISKCFLKCSSFPNYSTVRIRYMLQKRLNNFCFVLVSRPNQRPPIPLRPGLTSEGTGRNMRGEYDFNLFNFIYAAIGFSSFPNILLAFARQLLNS